VDILKWDAVIDQFVNKFSRLSADKKDDLRQEFYLALLQAEPPPDTREEVVSILHKTLDKTRRQDMLSKRRTVDMEEYVDAGVKPITEDLVLLHEALCLLPTVQSAIIQMIFIHGHTEAELAEIYDKSQSWISKQKAKGLATIKSILRGKDAHLNKKNNLD
jgi:DNA-directed RNA polymerase specialized sigma24 family protein